MDIKISKVELAIGRKKINLTIEEAIELKQLLNRTFDKEDAPTLYPSYPYWYYPVYPWDIGTVSIPSVGDGTITLDAVTTTHADCNWTAWNSDATLTLDVSGP